MVYLLNGDFGYDRTNVCTVSYDRVGKNQDSYRLITELKNCEAIEDVALTDSPFLPKRGWKSNSVNKNGLFIPVDIVDVSPRYFDFFSVKKVSGFSDLSEASLEDLAEKQEVIVLNESAADVFEVNDSLSETKDFMIKVYGLPDRKSVV